MWCKSLRIEKYISFRIKWFFWPPFLSVSPFLLLNLARRQSSRPEIKSWPDIKFCAHAHCVLPRCCLCHEIKTRTTWERGRAFFAFLITERLSTTISEPGTGYHLGGVLYFEQSWFSLQSYCTRNLSARITWWFAVALDEIRTRRILRQKADCKQSSGMYKTWVSGVSGGKREAEREANLLSLSLLGRPDTQAIVSGGFRPSGIRGVPGLKNNLFRIIYLSRGPPLDPLLIVYIKDRKNLKVNRSECRGKHHTKACFKHRATALLSWLDCSTTIARLGFRRRI